MSEAYAWAQARTPLADALAGPRTLAKDVLWVLGGAAFTAALAQVQVRLPFTPVPITGQTLAWLLCGLVLGSGRGVASQAIYVLAGGLGLPVFAGGSSGLAVLLGPSGGYLLGGLLAAWTVGRLAERGMERRLPSALATMAVGEIVLYVPGLLDLARFVGPSHLLVEGFLPFVPGDVLKMLLAALLLPGAWTLTHRVQKEPQS
jgi:biotin transport system substrate-specific component